MTTPETEPAEIAPLEEEGDSSWLEDPDAEEDEDEEDRSPLDGTPGGGSGHPKFIQLVKDLLNGQPLHILDLASALGQAIQAEAIRLEKSLEEGESIWRPAFPDADSVFHVEPNRLEAVKGSEFRTLSRSCSAAIRARLRNRFLQARIPKTEHGVRSGRELSERRLVDSMIEIGGNQRPTRPDQRPVKLPEVTIASAIVIDESGSMGGTKKDYAAQGALAIADALDGLRSPCLVVGPRSSHRTPEGYNDGPLEGEFHRHHGIDLALYKDWGEGMNVCYPRFGATQATGSTPLEDGIQYALQELADRQERHRVVFCLTDGIPDNPDVVRYQVRQAGEAGVLVVGVGLGLSPHEAKMLQELFPGNVAVDNLEGLAPLLLKVVEGMLFPAQAKKLRLENRIVRGDRRRL